MYLQSRVLSEIARQTLERSLHQLKRVISTDGEYRGVDVNDTAGGTRHLEALVFKAQKCSNGTVLVCTSYYAEARTLTSQWKYIVENHDTDKIQLWLEHKLITNI